MQAINEKLSEAVRANINEGVLRVLSHSAGGELGPVAALFGGLVGSAFGQCNVIGLCACSKSVASDPCSTYAYHGRLMPHAGGPGGA